MERNLIVDVEFVSLLLFLAVLFKGCLVLISSRQASIGRNLLVVLILRGREDLQ